MKVIELDFEKGHNLLLFFFFLTSFLLLNINVMACTVILKQTKRKKPLIHLSLSYFEFLLCGHGPNPR